MAVEGDWVVAVGNESDVAEFRDGASVYDLEGRLLTPGFTDAHVHPHHGGENLLGCNLLDASDAAESLEIIRRYLADHPGNGWVTGGGWSQDWFPNACPSAAALDEVAGGRPVYLGNRDGHGTWVNSAALALAGVSAATPDPSDGRIERLEDGSPQGTLHEGAMDLVQAIVPDPTPEETRAALARGQQHLLEHGITGWMDAWVDGPLHAAYRSLAAADGLVGSVVGALWWDRSGSVDQIERLELLRHEGVGRYRPTAVKLMLDGVVENFTASMLEPYEQVGGEGIDMIEPERLGEIVTRLDATGFQVHFHAIGDRAVRNALGAVEAARIANGWSGLRHSIAHLQVIHPEDLPRFHRLGVIANIQPFWACEDGYQAELTQPYLGPQRTSWQYPFASLARHGATLVGGSDWPVSTCDVFAQVQVATTRLPLEGEHEPLIPSEAIDPVTALAAFTAGSAWHNGDERRGTLARGNVADLVVVDHDPFIDGTFGEASVESVMADGEWVLGKEAR